MKKNFIIALSGLLLCFASSCHRPTTAASDAASVFDVDTLRVEQAREQVHELGPIMQNLADSIAALHGGRTCETNYKSLSSTLRKCWTDSVQADQLKDLVRTTITCPYDSLEVMITDLVNTAKSKNLFLRYKHQEVLERSYWGDIVNLQYKGMYCEIMVRSFCMAYATNNSNMDQLLGDSLMAVIHEKTQQEASRGHYFYEVVRDITGRYSEEEKAQAIRDSYEYYLHFWEAYQPGTVFYHENK